MIHNDYDSDYETLLKISGTPTMQIKRIKQLAIEIFKILKILGPKIWNALPTEVKRKTSLSKFKECVKLWSGHLCKCNLCKSI